MRKNWLKVLFATLLVAFVCSACSKEDDDKGTVSFVLEYTQSSNVDVRVLADVYDAFQTQFQSLDGVVIDKGAYVLKGEYATCNKAITNACERAENSVYALEPATGYFEITVTATYDKKDGKTVLYTKTYGTKE